MNLTGKLGYVLILVRTFLMCPTCNKSNTNSNLTTQFLKLFIYIFTALIISS